MLNERAALVADSLLTGGARSLDSTFSPSLTETSHPEFFRFWRTVADTLGRDVPRSEVLGTITSSPGSARTLVRLQGSKGSRVLTLDWLQGQLIHSASVPEEGLTMRFVPESRDRASRYDLWSGRTIRVERG